MTGFRNEGIQREIGMLQGVSGWCKRGGVIVSGSLRSEDWAPIACAVA